MGRGGGGIIIEGEGRVDGGRRGRKGREGGMKTGRVDGGRREGREA